MDDADATVTYTSEKAFVDIVTGRMNLVNAYFKQKFVVSDPAPWSPRPQHSRTPTDAPP